MAKIGNESKLILKLASERAEKQATEVYKRVGNTDYYAGQRDALNWYRDELYQIVSEIESK